MNIEKSKVKLLVVESIGNDVEDNVEAAQVKVHKYQGAGEGRSQASKIISEMSARAKDDLLNEKSILDPTDTLAAAKFVVAQMQIIVSKIHELSENARIAAIKAEGERVGYDQVVKKVKKVFDDEVTKLKAFEAQLAEGKVVNQEGILTHVGEGSRPVGTHPGPTLKMRRQAEEATSGNGKKSRSRSKRGKSDVSNP